MKKLKYLIIGIQIGLLLFTTKVSYAARPLSTEDARVAGKGSFQIEIGSDFVNMGNRENEYTFLFVPIYGITERLEISAELPYSLINHNVDNQRNGFSDINFVLKDLIIPEGDFTPAFLLKTQIKLANGDVRKGFGNGDIDVSLIFVLTKELRKFTFHLNPGYTFVGKKVDNSLNDYILYDAACEYALNKKLKITGEVHVESDTHYDKGIFKHYNLNPLAGLIYQLNGKTIFDIGFKTGISHGKILNHGLTLGMSISF